MSYTTYLAHHGIKGQKWGIRRYQNEDGSLTSAGIKRVQNSIKRLRKKSKKYNRKAKIVSKIVSTLSDDEYMLLNPGISKKTISSLGRDYFNKSAGEANSYTAKRIIIRDKKLQPASYLDAHLVPRYGEKPTLNISIATANNNATRGKGYADKAVKKMLKWHAKNKKLFGDIEWDVAPNNVASRRLAEKNGFEYAYTDSYNGWVRYIHHSALSHHGIKGQKWGTRRTPEQLGHVNGGTPKIYKLHNYNGKLYFISREEMDGKTLNPRIPDNFLTRNGFEDGTTKRICFSHDPGKCLTAMSQNVSGQSFNVYEPAEKHDVYKPNNIVVPDADITGEMWIKEPVKLKKVGTIKCTGDTGEAGLPYKYGNNTAELYDWNYEWTSSKEVRHSVIVNDDIYSYRSYLAHHGIKGQKWGVRRFQKADGSLTTAGAKRYGIKGAMSAGRKVGAGLVKAARGGIQKAKEVKARKAAEKLERQKKVWAKTRLGLTMNADKFSIEELREANNRLDERDRAARGLAEQVKRGVGYFQAIRDVTGAIKDTKDYIEDISGEKGKKAKAADELKYQRELEKEKRTYERDMVRDKVKADQEYEYKREKDRLDRESKEKIEKMKAKAKKKKESGGSDPEPEPEPDDAPKKKKPSENTTEFEDVYWNSSKKDREFMETVFPKEVDEAIERKNRRNKARRERNKARREVDEAIRRMGFFGHSDISIYGAYLEHHGIKGQKWGVRRFQNEDGTLTKAGMKRAGYKFKTLRKNATASRILIDENEDTSNLDRAYFSTNNLDNQKWANYFASIGAQYLDKSAYSINFKTKKKLIIARGEEISKVASKLMDKDDTFRKEFEATKQKQIQSTGSEEAWESLSESAKYSAMIAYKCEGGKKIISAMKDIGFDGVEDLFGKDVSKDPIIIFNPGSNLRQVGQKQELKGLYRGYRKYYGLPINHSSFSCNNISNNAGGSNQMFMNDDLLAYGAYLEHHGIKGQKWGVRRYQNEDGSLTTAGLKRQARRYTKELNKNDKALAVSRAHGIMARNELSNLDARVDRLRKAGKHEKAEKVLAKQQKRRAKLKDAKEMWDEKTLKTYERQFEIADACKKLKIDVTAKDTYRSTRTRGEKIANFAINVLAASLGVHRISRSEIQGTKYKAKYKEAEHTVDNNVTNYGKGGTIRKQYSTSYEDGDGSRRRNRRTSTSRYN